LWLIFLFFFVRRSALVKADFEALIMQLLVASLGAEVEPQITQNFYSGRKVNARMIARDRGTFVYCVLSVFCCLLMLRSAHAQIKIGAVSCLSGGLSTFGVSSIQGAKLAVEEINSQGGILGQQIELIVEDNQSKSGESATIARKLVSQDQVAAILGDLTSSATMEIAPLAQENKVPLLTPSATNVAITKTGDYVFRSCFIDPFTGQVMAKFALEHLKAKRALILTDVKQDYSVGLTEAIRQYFNENGGQVVKEISFSSGDSDFRAQLATVRSVRPDVIFLPAYYTEAALILRQAKQLGITAPIVGGEGWDSPALLQVAGASADGDFYVNHFSAADPAEPVQNFVHKYEAKYHAPPDALAALWYDGAAIICNAIQRAESTDGAKIRDALASTKNFGGVTGQISIDTNRNASKPGVILTIQDGRVQMVQQVIP
jgi:branched-chain amino acid transport system substrate-binding protein